MSCSPFLFFFSRLSLFFFVGKPQCCPWPLYGKSIMTMARGGWVCQLAVMKFDSWYHGNMVPALDIKHQSVLPGFKKKIAWLAWDFTKCLGEIRQVNCVFVIDLCPNSTLKNEWWLYKELEINLETVRKWCIIKKRSKISSILHLRRGFWLSP